MGQTQARPLGQELTPCVVQGSTTEDPMRPRSKKENRPSDLRAYGVSTVPIFVKFREVCSEWVFLM